MGCRASKPRDRLLANPPALRPTGFAAEALRAEFGRSRNWNAPICFSVLFTEHELQFELTDLKPCDTVGKLKLLLREKHYAVPVPDLQELRLGFRLLEDGCSLGAAGVAAGSVLTLGPCGGEEPRENTERVAEEGLRRRAVPA